MPDIYDVADVILLTAGYWTVDRAVRADGWVQLLARIGVQRRVWVIGLWLLPWLALAPVWQWNHLAAGTTLRFLTLMLAAMLTWNAVTKDVDLGTGNTNGVWRVLLVASTLGVYFSPSLVLVTGLLLTHPFAVWQHHATLPMRLVQVLMAHLCIASLLAETPFGGVTALMFFVLTIVISHYLITAAAKALLGPRWYSWVKDNSLHHLAANAYSWGWARFLPWRWWLRVIKGTKRVEKPLQLSAFCLELLSPLALLHPWVAISFCCAWAAFHGGVFLLSGLLFWDWAVTNLILAYVIYLLPAQVTDELFGPVSVLASVVFMLIFPLRHKLWKPMPLGWFDTPLTQRVHWRVRGASGKLYGLYNNFMCPHERLYGKVHGCFLVPVQVMTYHLGEVYKADLRDAIRQAGPDLNALGEVRHRFGILPRSEEMTARHVAYLRRFFQQLNRGARKQILPRWLRWLKAPGGQIFYWGELPAFRGQERALTVSIAYREEYFDGQTLKRLRDDDILEVEIDAVEEREPVSEFTPKEMDEFLLKFAAGRLIDLPGIGGGYVQSDDGRPVS